MAMPNKSSITGNLAVLIDADNVSSKIIKPLMEEIAKHGSASVRRIYGDWTSPYLKSWRECLLDYSIIPIQQFAYTSRKNATDGTMIIDAMDLLYTARFSGFCIISSDCDFTRLAARIREQGLKVIGFGQRNTVQAFVRACDEFIYFDALSQSSGDTEATDQTATITSVTIPSSPLDADPEAQHASPRRSQPPQEPRAMASRGAFASGKEIALPVRMSLKPRPLDAQAVDGFANAIKRSTVYEDPYVNLADVGGYLKKLSPDLTARNYGYDRLSDFVKASGIVDLKWKQMPSGPPIVLVALKSDFINQSASRAQEDQDSGHRIDASGVALDGSGYSPHFQ